MKHTIITLSLLALCTQQIAFSMEKEDDTWSEIELKSVDKKNHEIIETQSVDELVATISTTIYKKYPAIRSMFGWFNTPPLTEQDCLDITKIIYQHSNNLSNVFITKLYTKLCTANKRCKDAIEYFIDIARANRDSITIYSLENIQDPTQIPLNKQFLILNELPTPLKQAIIETAYARINHAYDIVLTGHTDNINYFDICVATHHAATSSKDKTLRLWDLQTGQSVRTFPEDNADTIFCIAFNPDGSLLATAEKIDKPKFSNLIKIWATKSAQLLHTIKHNAHIVAFHYGHDNTLVLCSDRHTDIKILTINDNVTTLTEKTRKFTLKYDDNKSHNYAYWNDIYKTKDPYLATIPTPLVVKKLNCRTLYLYEQAIRNTECITSATQNLLNQQPAFNTLTELEKNKVTTLFLAKKQQLDAQKLLIDK